MSETLAYSILSLVAIDCIVSVLIWNFVDRSQYRGDGDIEGVIKGIFVFNVYYGIAIAIAAVTYSVYLIW